MGEAKGQREGKTVLMMLGTKGDLEEKRVVVLEGGVLASDEAADAAAAGEVQQLWRNVMKSVVAKDDTPAGTEVLEYVVAAATIASDKTAVDDVVMGVLTAAVQAGIILIYGMGVH